MLFGPTLERSTDAGVTEDAWQTQISTFWNNTYGISFSPRLIDRVWTAARCIHLNAQQIARMPLRFFGTREPSWVSNPDPVWFRTASETLYTQRSTACTGGETRTWYITSRYADGYPSAWTVLNAENITVEVKNGRSSTGTGRTTSTLRTWCRCPGTHGPDSPCGTSAIKAYSAQAYGLLAAQRSGPDNDGVRCPNTILQPKRKVDADQAVASSGAVGDGDVIEAWCPGDPAPDIDIHQNKLLARRI